jgi:serine/threonine protein kinase
VDEPLQKTLERYDVLDRIAVGGMAEVFLAKAYGAHGFEKTLAIKKILPELARDAEFEARFIAEAKVAVRLSHANVVQVFDFGRIGESLFIAMEYVDGLDLAALLRKLKEDNRLVPLPAAFHIAIEIVRALDFAHQHNVVHRDVSPSNILISRAGEVKIGDFGIAVAASPHKAAGPGARKVMGKWRYMSPEQTRGDTLDTRSDLFSAAVVLFELFTGEKLFPGDEADDIITNIENMPIPKANALRPGLPSRLDDILAGPLARKPIDRPNRPAVVLRSLIELSYESSIMATALDVAETVAGVLPPRTPSGPGMHLDDVIRKQLGAAQEKSVARRTAVTSNKPPSTSTMPVDNAGDRGEHSTGLFRRIGADGVSQLEQVDPLGTTARHERASDSGLHKLLDAHQDPDRRTEIGGPPTGQVPKVEPGAGVSRPGTKSQTTYTGGSRRVVLLAVAGLALAAAGVGAWVLTRGGETSEVIAAPRDARAGELTGELELDPEPEGSKGTITGPRGDVYPFGPTSHAKPTFLRVTANVKVHVHIEHDSYRAFDDDREVLPDKTMVIEPRLQKLRAVLHVVTVPPGAQVALGTKVLGETPFTRDDLEPALGAEMTITHSGYEPHKMKVDLAVGDTREIDVTLKAAQRYGSIRVSVPGSWGDIYFKGARIGRAPTPDPIRLPVGRQILHLKNTAANKEWDQACEVKETEVTTCTTAMP